MRVETTDNLGRNEMKARSMWALLLLPGCQTQTDRRWRLSEVLLRKRWLRREALRHCRGRRHYGRGGRGGTQRLQ